MKNLNPIYCRIETKQFELGPIGILFKNFFAPTHMDDRFFDLAPFLSLFLG